MNVLKVVLNALPEKRRELEQALTGMLPGIRGLPGCQRCQLARDIEAISNISIVSYWTSRKDVTAFFVSDGFAALMGTKILLQEDPMVYLDEVVASEGMDAINLLRLGKPNSEKAS